jgi:mannosyltransferase OCH1-like enzyme
MIPKTIHKVIIVDDGKLPNLPDGIKKAMETFYRMNPGYKVKIYTGDDCVKYIKDNYNEEILHAYNSLKPYAYKSDLMRQLILYKEGGWYTDVRMVCLQSLDLLNKQDGEFYACIDTPQRQMCMCNGFIGVIAGHEVTKKMIDLIMWNIKHKHYGLDCLNVTGPATYMTACIDFLRQHNENCFIGKHVIENGEQLMYFSNVKFIKVKYNDAKGADNSDILGTNDYGQLWRNNDVYLNNELTYSLP